MNSNVQDLKSALKSDLKSDLQQDLSAAGHEDRARTRVVPVAFPAARRHATLGTSEAQAHVNIRPLTAKRILDVVFAGLGLVLTAPLILILAIIIRLDSKGPVLLRQTRVGRGGRPFELIKLRSMLAGAHVTRVGRLIRPLGLDELPQLVNVLRGEMSIVGPRPERPHLVAEYESKLMGYARRHAVRPGITGWAQIHGLRGGERPIAERLRFDLEYVRRHNVVQDLRILTLTFSAVWRDTRRELKL